LQHADLPAHHAVGLSPPVRRRELRRGRRRPQPCAEGGRGHAAGGGEPGESRGGEPGGDGPYIAERELERCGKLCVGRGGGEPVAAGGGGERAVGGVGKVVVTPAAQCVEDAALPGTHGQLLGARPPRLPLEALSRAGQPAREHSCSVRDETG